MSPCKAVPGADEVPVTTQTSSWSFWQLSMHPRFSALGELCPHPCFHLLSHSWCQSQICFAREPCGSCLQTTQPCKAVLGALCTMNVPLPDQLDLEWMRMSKNRNNPKNNKYTIKVINANIYKWNRKNSIILSTCWKNQYFVLLHSFQLHWGEKLFSCVYLYEGF